MPKFYFSWDEVKYAGRYLKNLQFSVECFVFSDYGYTKYRQDENTVVRKGVSAWGGGLQFQLPYVETAHLVAGWGPKDSLMDAYIKAKIGVTF